MWKRAAEVRVGEEYRVDCGRRGGWWRGPVQHIDTPPHCLEGNVILNSHHCSFECKADERVEVKDK